MLRQEIAEDYNEVERLVYSAYENSKLYNYQKITEHTELAELRKLDNFCPELSLVVQEGWEIVGSIVCTVNQGAVEIKQMVVLPVLQNTGVGLQLVLETRDVARTMGFSKIIVKSDLNNFKQYGFTKKDDYFEMSL